MASNSSHFQRVLRGQDEERQLQLVNGLGHRHAALGHGFEHGRLRLGRSAVDLVGQDHVAEDRALLELELLAAAAVVHDDVRADDVGRHQVGGELNAAEMQVQGLAQGADEHGLADAGYALQQRVAAGQQAAHHLLDHLVHADDDLGDLGPNCLVMVAEAFDPFVTVHEFSPSFRSSDPPRAMVIAPCRTVNGIVAAAGNAPARTGSRRV